MFYHGDDWKMGPQAAARAAVIEAVEEYGGRVVEPEYTKNVSSTEFQSSFDTAIKESVHTGVLVRTTLNDIKRTSDVIQRETGVGTEVLDRLIDGKEFDRQNVDAIVRTLHHTHVSFSSSQICQQQKQYRYAIAFLYLLVPAIAAADILHSSLFCTRAGTRSR